jgi:RNA polymerase sigma factor (sigma-70 family)
MTTSHWTILESHIRKMNEERGWGLNKEEISFYAKTLISHIPKNSSEIRLRSYISNFHQDHALVHLLMRNDATAWSQLFQDIHHIIRGKLAFYSHEELSLEDAIQLAAEEVFRSLESYSYASRLSTWIYSIVLHTIQGELRYSTAAKRAIRPASLDVPRSEIEDPIYEAEHPEQSAYDRALASLIDTILSAQNDKRLAIMFRLWAIEDMRLADVARHMHLSPGRVSALLSQALTILRSDPTLLEWINTTLDNKTDEYDAGSNT